MSLLVYTFYLSLSISISYSVNYSVNYRVNRCKLLKYGCQLILQEFTPSLHLNLQFN
jgi:hypothetical protein